MYIRSRYHSGFTRHFKLYLLSVSYIFATSEEIVPKSGNEANGYVFADAEYFVSINGGKSSFVEVMGIGLKGEKGDPGTGDAHFEHDQMIAASTWNITHNLNKHPSVTIVTSAGDEAKGQISYPGINQVIITFSAPFGGKAYLN